MKPKVYSVAIEVTAHCQQKCDYCYNAWREDNGAGFEAGAQQRLLARATKLFDALDIDHITVTGGEPFARKDVFDLFALAKSRGVGIQVISNGGLIDDALAARVASFDVSYVQVTLDGPTKELHEAHVGEGHFDPTLRGIRALVAHGVPVIGCIVVTRKNAAHVGEILALFASLGVHDIALSRFSPAGYAASFVAELLPSRADLLVAFRQALPFARGEGGARKTRITCTMPVPPCAVETEDLAPLKFGSCAIGTTMQEFALGPDGSLRHCTLHAKGLGGAKDILDPSVDVAAIVTGREVRDYKKTLPSFCEGCLHASSCGGGCGAAAEWVLGSRALPDPFLWQHVDDAFGGTLAEARSRGGAGAKRRLEVIA
ncbi:MAG: radical SAM protein [Deltaproteobacteria bacterium]|nr:radical SAM protein [Deltaproteobacteria bacterium]